MENLVIKVENLQKTYKMGDIEVKALRGVSLNITEGEFIAIMGSSGSGKSTFMNIIGCLDRPTAGEYFLEGIDIKEKTENDLSYIRNQKIGFVFQAFNLIPRTTSLKNVELPLIYGKISSNERKERAKSMLEIVGLGDRIYHLPNELSGGQKQRVAIARALANNPSIILADEPTGNLDEMSANEVIELLLSLQKAFNLTLVLVTHDKDVAFYADRIVQMRDGKIEF